MDTSKNVFDATQLEMEEVKENGPAELSEEEFFDLLAIALS